MKEVWRTSRGQNTSKQRAVLLHLKLVWFLKMLPSFPGIAFCK
jgi:hypothetical protein